MFIELPVHFRATGYVDDLSLDMQLYVRCPKCSFEERASPSYLALVTPKRLKTSPCPRCQHGRREIVRYRAQITVACQDCHQTTQVEIVPWEEVRCPGCLSTNFVEGELVDPPMPSVFGELGERLTLMLGPHDYKEHPWGVDGSEDAAHLVAELQRMQDEPDAYRHVLASAIFARRLITSGGYPATDYYYLLTALGNLERQYFNATGELAVGVDAVEVFTQSVTIAPDVENRASAEHNVAMALNSLLLRYDADGLAEVTGWSDPRQAATDAALSALRSYEAIAARTPDVVFFTTGAPISPRQQAGRVHHLLGDLISRSPHTDAAIRLAITHYDAALAAGLPEVMLPGLGESLAVALTNLASPTQAELRRAAAELQAITT